MLLRVLVAAMVAGAAGAQSQGPSIEACIGCHALGEPAPVGNVADLMDLHYVDVDPAGPATPSGYRQLNVAFGRVDVTGAAAVVEFAVTDENGVGVSNIFDTDGRLVVARLVDGVDPMDPATAGDPTEWQRLVSEGFTTGTLQFLGGGDYRYTSAFDPTAVSISAGQTLRAAIEISESDIPAGNGWCDFDADLALANGCDSPTSLTRDIIRTATCNGCHGVTSDTKLSFHGNGGRTEMEYCVTCHNPDRNSDTGMTTLTHKIHYGSQLTEDYRGGKYQHVNFTRDIDDCTSCHEAGPVDADNWKTEPNRESCGSCHDDVNFDTGEGHGSGGQQPTNRFCSNCHPPEGMLTASLFPVATVHQGLARADEGALYRGPGNGFAIESTSFDRAAETLTVEFSVARGGEKMDLQSDPEWTNGGRLNLDLAWSTEDYTNEGSGSDPAPAQPVVFSALDIGNTVTDLGNGSYRTVIDISTFGFGSLTVGLEGYPTADLLETGAHSRIPVRSDFETVSVEPRESVRPRRKIVEIDKCNACHDSGGAGLSFHGGNRTGEIQVCVLCHNADATDIRRRPADPGQTPDGKREESVDMKRMIHQIHMGGDLEEPVVIYGFGGTPHDYSSVSFVGNNMNCLTCHDPDTYSTDDAWHALPATIDTGADVTDPSDDLNISPVTTVCSSCHDSAGAVEHMVDFGGTFGSFDSEISRPTTVPEPAWPTLMLAGLVALGLLVRRRQNGSGS